MITDDVAAAVLDSLPSRIAVLGPDGTVIRLNDAWRRSAAAGLVVVPVRPGTSWLAACEAGAQGSSPLRALGALTRRMLNSRRDHGHIELPVTTPRGERWVDVRIRPLSRGDGLVVVADDITERHDHEKVLRHRATHDPVTGLLNRSALRDLIDASLGTRPADGDDVGLLFLDLDEFRLVNHRFGYAVGDAALQAAARRFQETVGSEGVLGHWGGDQFVVVTTRTSRPAAMVLADRLSSCLAEPLEANDQEVRITVSVGLAFGSTLRFGPDTAPPPGEGAAAAATPQDPSTPPPPDAMALVRMASEEIVRMRARNQGPLTARSSPHQPPESGSST
ncbi:diguanylate cyclase [Parafrankia sp. FMc2]|uniref:diguanylate cyclase n=1 Tax=Parafrankia sp. FMc2 TaxID=3233196 RepID=UPI0034D4AB59